MAAFDNPRLASDDKSVMNVTAIAKKPKSFTEIILASTIVAAISRIFKTILRELGYPQEIIEGTSEIIHNLNISR